MKRNIILMAMVAGLILFLALWGPAACQKMRSQQAQSKLDRAQGDAFENSAADAINTQGAANVRERESEDVSRSNREDIRNAKGSDAAVDPAARDAAFRGLCKRASFRATEQGKLRCPPAP
jgi:hypothetical protein